jgi:hypothetical protein
MVAGDSAPGDTSSFAAYFFLASLDEDEGGPFLVPVHREVPHTLAVATAALNALFAGPTAGEASSVPAISSNVPAGTTLLGVSVAGGIADVDLSAEFESGGGSASVLGRLAQLTYTVTQFPTVDAVRLYIEGELATEFSSEGVIIDAPLTREDFEDFLPAIFVDSPHYFGPAGNPMRIVGNANVFEAQFIATITDNDGLILAEVPVTASCGTGCRGTFDVTIPYALDAAELGALIVFDESAQDGSPQHVREYPVILTPAPEAHSVHDQSEREHQRACDAIRHRCALEYWRGVPTSRRRRACLWGLRGSGRRVVLLETTRGVDFVLHAIDAPEVGDRGQCLLAVRAGRPFAFLPLQGLERVEHDLLEELAQGDAIELREALEHLDHALLHAHAKLHALDGHRVHAVPDSHRVCHCRPPGTVVPR